MNKLNFICFKVKTDEVVRFQCRTTSNNNLADKDLISFNGFYFIYVFNRNEKTGTYSLRQIDKDEFIARKNEWLQYRPRKYSEEWTDGKNKFMVRNYYEATWRRDVPAADCIFFDSDSPLKDIYEAVMADVSRQKEQNEAYNQEEKYQYARKCGGLGKKLGINYVNVMRIGPEKGKLMKFKESYERAIREVKGMSLPQLRKMHTDLFRSGRAHRKQAMEKLGIQYFAADVNLLVLKELEDAMQKRLDDYILESVKRATSHAINCDYQTRKQMYDDLMSSSRKQKKEILSELGVNVDAIDVNKYPLSEIKRALAATLGSELER